MILVKNGDKQTKIREKQRKIKENRGKLAYFKGKMLKNMRKTHISEKKRDRKEKNVIVRML